MSEVAPGDRHGSVSAMALAALDQLDMPEGHFVGRFRPGRNGVYLLRDKGEDYVLKLFLSEESHRREAAALALLASDPLVPQLMKSGKLPNGPAFVLTNFVAGIPLSRLVATKTGENAGFYRQAAKRIHAIASARCDDLTPFPLSHVAALALGESSLAAQLIPLAVLGADVPERLERVAAPMIEELRAQCEIVLSHGDYQPKNLVVRPGHDLAGIVDWERAERATRWEECGHLLRYALDDASEAAVLGGYAGADDPPADWVRLCRTTDLLNLSIELGRRISAGHRSDRRAPMLLALLQICEGGAPDWARTTARSLLEL